MTRDGPDPGQRCRRRGARPSCWTGVVRRTPLEHSRGLAERVGGPVWLKCENLQRTGSFKIRGAYTRIARLTDEERARGVVAASAGNHAQGVALAARAARRPGDGVHAGDRAAAQGGGDPRPTARRCGSSGQTLDEALRGRGRVRRARPARCSSTPSTTPTSSPGRARSASRCSSSARTSRTVWSCAGGGGLVVGRRGRGEGAAVPTSGWSPCRPRAPRRFPASLAAGRPVAADRAWRRWPTASPSAAPGELTFAHVRDLVDEVRTVTEEDLSRALLFCLERAKLVVEPAGVGRGRRRARRPGGLRAAGGRGALRRQHRPGAAAQGGPARHGRRRPLPVAAAARARPARVAGRGARRARRRRRQRARGRARADRRPGCDVGEVEVFVVLETRGPEHADEVAARADPRRVAVRRSTARESEAGVRHAGTLVAAPAAKSRADLSPRVTYRSRHDRRDRGRGAGEALRRAPPRWTGWT